MIMKLKILSISERTYASKILNNINIARLYSCLLSQLGPAVMERTVVKNKYGILDVAFSRRGK